MRTFGFGQKSGQIMQMAYTVRNIHSAIDWWIRNANVGPWFLLDSFTGPEQRYRGEPTEADVALAMSFAGHMNIELIPATDSTDEMFTRYWKASVNWDGKDPIRKFG